MKRLSALTALALAATALTVPAAATTDSTAVDPALTQRVNADEAVAPAGEQTVIDAGHVDMGPRIIDGQWQVLARDDTAATPTWRQTNDVVYRVSDDARLDVPEGYDFVGGTQAWVIPQQEISGVPWLGWNTQDPAVIDQVNGTVNIVFEGHEGPGTFTAFVQAGNFQGPDLLWDSAKAESQPISVELNTHTHVNWAFTEPGVHRIRLSFTATLNDGTTAGGTAYINVAVGSETSVDDVWAAIAAAQPDSTTPDGSADASEQTGEGQSGAGQSSNGSEQADDASPDATARDQRDSSTGVVVLGMAGLALLVVAVFVVLRKRTSSAQARALEDK